MNPNGKSVRVAQFETLEWVFLLGKKYGCSVVFQDRVKKVLVRVSDGETIDFEKALKELTYYG